ncbi:hypothetical protein BDV06DRAFT_132557 [Aspergillus oleicola]
MIALTRAMTIPALPLSLFAALVGQAWCASYTQDLGSPKMANAAGDLFERTWVTAFMSHRATRVRTMKTNGTQPSEISICIRGI